MNRKTKYTINGALIGGIGKAFFNASHQLDVINHRPEMAFNWKECLWEAFKGGLAGGAIGYGIGALVDYNNEQIRPINTDPILLELVNKLKLNTNSKLYMQLCEKAEIVTNHLQREFGEKLKGYPMRLGSTEKGTALKRKFDIDICLPFRANSFRSTEVMFDSVLEFLKTLKDRFSIVEVRDQKKSIGVIVTINGGEHKIDIVPYKLTKKKGNRSGGYLYVNNKSIFANNASYTKTNVDALRNQRLTETQKRIIIILKHWKSKNNLLMSSHLLENLVLDAYKYHYGAIPRRFTDKVIMVLQHIVDNLDIAVIRSVENSNNIITNIPEANKTEIINASRALIDEYDYQPNSITEALR